jgi:hypothetical protein
MKTILRIGLVNGTRETLERWIAAGERLLRELKDSQAGDEQVRIEAVLRRDLAHQRKRLACLERGYNGTDQANLC